MNARKILIADDEPYVARVLRLVLQGEGHDVTCVTNGLDALESFVKHRPDVLVTDVKMPHMGGRDLVEKIRTSEGGKDMPIIVMTSTLESDNREWVENMGNVSFVGKPVSPRDLVRIIARFFTRQQDSRNL